MSSACNFIINRLENNKFAVSYINELLALFDGNISKFTLVPFFQLLEPAVSMESSTTRLKGFVKPKARVGD